MADTITRTTTCQGCTDPDLNVVLSHDCSEDPRQDARRRRVDMPASPNARRSTDGSARRSGTSSNRRPNRYAARCVRCGGQVAAEAGWLTKDSAGRWAADHRGDCPVVARPTPAPVAPAAPALPGADQVPAGSYALDGTDGAANEVVFYQVDRPTKGSYAGRVFVALVVGGQSNRNVRRDHVAGILARIVAAGPQAAMARYGHEIGRCGVCHRHLTDDDSRARGIGPVCAAGLGW